jgi:hypothetical protein
MAANCHVDPNPSGLWRDGGASYHPVTSTDNALARYDGVLGVIQDSGVICDDSNNLSSVGTVGCGAITADADQDTAFAFGRCRISSVTADAVYLSHYDQHTTTSAAVLQLAAGGTFIQSGAGQTTSLRNGTGAVTMSIALGVVTVNGYLDKKTTATITASTNQAQGQGALTSTVNEVATCANPDDAVTLPAAVAGRNATVINNGANTLQIWPASGDNLGIGVDTSEQLQVNETVTYVAYDGTNWAKESTTEIVHAEMHDEDNTDAFVVNDAGGDFHAYHTNGLAVGDVANWTFDAGGAGTSHAIASIADSPGSSGVQAQITTGDAHGLAAGDIVSLTNMSAGTNAGLHVVVAPVASTTFEIVSANSTNATGTMDQAATLDAGAGADGVYQILWFASATSATNNETFDFELRNNAALITGTKVRRKFGTAADFGSFSGGGVASVAAGDKISLALSNGDTAGNITIRNFTLILVRL